MENYIVKHNVPIIDEHTITDEDGRPIVRLDVKRLMAIATKANRRVRDTGDEVPITIGHTRDDVPAGQQPEIVGYASNFTVGPLFRTGRKAVKATFRLFKRSLDKIRLHPRRSVELWLSDWKIDPISLLGAETPERDLGLLRLSRDGRKKYRRILPLKRYSREANLPMEHQELIEAMLAALKETDVWKWAEAQMAKESKPGDGGQDGGLDGLEGDQLADDLDEDVDGHRETEGEEGGEGPPEYEENYSPVDRESEEDDDGEAPLRMNAASPAAPSGSNTFVPGGRSIGKKDRQRMQRDGLRIRLSRAEAMLAEQAKVNRDLRLKFQRAERERDLVQLEGEGYILDREEELDNLQSLAEDAYQKRLATIRRRYQRAPVGRVPFAAADLRSPTGSKFRTKEQAVEIANLAVKKGISYEQALNELEGSTN